MMHPVLLTEHFTTIRDLAIFSEALVRAKTTEKIAKH